MGKNNKLFGEEKIGKLLLRFSIPIIISFLVSELYNMVDTLFVGRTVGGYGIGGLVLVFPIQRIIIALSVMIAVGTSTAFSRSNGQNNMDQSRKIVRNGFSLSFLLMVSITAIIYIFSEKILLGLGASHQTLPYAKDYLDIIIFGSTFLSLTTFISNIMISVGNNKVSIISTSIGAIINIILDYILVVEFKMGVKGAAIATTVSQIIGFSYAYYNYSKVKKEFKIPSGFEFDKRLIKAIILVGLSAFIIESEDGVLMAVRNHLLLNTAGDNGIIVLGVISKIYMFLFITMFGIASAMQPIAAFNVGAKNYKRLKTVMQKTSIYAFLTSMIMWLIAMIYTPQLISIFVKEPEIISESVKAFRIVVAALPMASIYYVSIFYFQALGKAKTSIFLSISKQLILTIPISVILVKVFHLGAMGVWLAYPISDILASIASYMLIREERQELNIKIENARGTVPFASH
ncbi:MATE family efflux transporter [Tissierella carlieri]|jgi:putative MATE family efflux protein|uniref:MATE family efflux transporter n=1 Tax=Tissierella carlieri TaxID=689904 RepID=UPI0028044B87|nr:MATE family efflux transporter [uncultured Tissierella sp.]MDU5082526.1 MATE family efflux transporter [Bacillota bacterium]